MKNVFVLLSKKGLLPSLVFIALLLAASQSAIAAGDAALELLRKAAQTARSAEGVRAGDYQLKDQYGVSFSTSEYSGKPLLVSFIFTNCPDICNTVVASLAPAIETVKKELGDKFSALVVGFDAANDTPQAMLAFGKSHDIDFSLVRFASGSAEVMERMTSDLGFYFEADEEAGFNHLGLVSIIDSKGVIYRQVYKTELRPADISGPLGELFSDKRKASRPTLLTQIKSLCLKYDPATGEYRIDYAFILGIVLQAIVVAICFWLGFKNEIRGFFRKKFGRV
ncbi:MAG: SCO family protein [Proteobacteria bacterium]|nr:SCO family protein [Pseudomonadota bacterium]